MELTLRVGSTHTSSTIIFNYLQGSNSFTDGPIWADRYPYRYPLDSMTSTDALLGEIDRLQALEAPANDLAGTMQVGSECYQRTMTLLNAVYGAGSAKENYLVEMGRKAFQGNAYAVASVLLPALHGALTGLRAAIEGGGHRP